MIIDETNNLENVPLNSKKNEKKSKVQTQIPYSETAAKEMDASTRYNGDNLSECKVDMSTHKKIWITVSRAVSLNKLETEIIDTPAFQRLGKLKQLGTSYIAFPSAKHTRFEHSIGTLHVASIMINSIRNNKENVNLQKEIPEVEEQLARLLALLHDICHLPFGHTIEDEFRVLEKHDQDLDRYEYFLGPKSIIGKIIIEHTSDMFYDCFYKIITIKKGEEEKLGKYLYLYDLVNNTVCADLLDYLQRDYYHCGIALGLDFRFIDHLYIFKDDKGCKRIAVRLQTNEEKPRRTDLLDELVSLLDHRYKISQVVYFHQAKIIAGTMLAGALARVLDDDAEDILTVDTENNEPAKEKISREELYKMGDDELILRLKKIKGRPKVREIVQALDERRLYKCVYERGLTAFTTAKGVEYSNKDLVDDIKAKCFDNPKKRLDIEKSIADQLGMEYGDVLIHCPDYSMQMKHAEMNVFWDGSHRKLKECGEKEKGVVFKKLQLILDSHKDLWRIRVSVNPKYCKTEREKEQIIDAIEYHLYPNIKNNNKAKKHYSNIAGDIIMKNKPDLPLNLYKKVKQEVVEQLMIETDSERKRKDIEGVVLNELNKHLNT